MKTRYFCANCGREVRPEATSARAACVSSRPFAARGAGSRARTDEFSAGCPACGHLRPTLGDAPSPARAAARAATGPQAARAPSREFYLVAGIGLSALAARPARPAPALALNQYRNPSPPPAMRSKSARCSPPRPACRSGPGASPGSATGSRRQPAQGARSRRDDEQRGRARAHGDPPDNLTEVQEQACAEVQPRGESGIA